MTNTPNTAPQAISLEAIVSAYTAAVGFAPAAMAYWIHAFTNNILAAASAHTSQQGSADSWAPARIWLQRGIGDGGSHTWCEDQIGDDIEEAEYVRADAALTQATDSDVRRDAERYRWAIEVEENASTLHSIVLCHEGETEKIGGRVDEYRAALSRPSQVAMS